MKVCFFGSYAKDYSKNSVLIKGLTKQKVKLIYCYHPNYFTLLHYPSLLFQFLKKARDCDIIFVAFFGHYDVWFAWVLGKLFQKKVIFDPLISIYNTRVEDRKYFRPGSLRAKFYIFFDWFNVHLSDKVFIDTNVHFEYWHQKFRLSRKKAIIIRVGADDELLKPATHTPSSNLTVLFYGSYQPSQGPLNMIKAANLLKNKNINWVFIGEGQQRKAVENYATIHKLSKVKFINNVPFLELVSYINEADILLGVFGNTVKTRMVIHNKIYQAIAMGKPLITQDTPAVREILKSQENCILTKPTPLHIANAVVSLSQNPENTNSIGKNARRTFVKNFTASKIGAEAKKAFSLTLNTS